MPLVWEFSQQHGTAVPVRPQLQTAAIVLHHRSSLFQFRNSWGKYVMTVTQTDDLRVRVRQDLTAVRETLEHVIDDESLSVLNLLKPHDPDGKHDRRDYKRASVQIPLYIACVAFDGEYVEALPDAADEILVMTRDVSLSGIGFTHDEPLLSEFVNVTFDRIDADPVTLLLHVKWSSPKRSLPHMSGGNFLGIVERC